MSALRLAQPGKPVRLIDLGPSAARMKAQTYHITVATAPNMIPVLSSELLSDAEQARRRSNAEASARYRAKVR